jgi:heat shock protein HtpX
MTQEQPVLIYDRIDANRRKTRLFLTLFALVLLPAAAYVALYVSFVAAIFTFGLGSLISGDDWQVGLILGAVVAVSILLGAAFLEYRYAAVLVLRLAGARPVGPDEEPDLRRTVENLCIGAGLPQPKLYIIESVAPNAFAAGLDPEHASLAVTRGLLVLLDDRELEGVTAHELSHIGNYDTRLSTVVAVGVALLRLPLLIVVGFFRFLFRLHWAVGVGALLYIVLPILASIPFSVSLTMDELESDPRLGLLMLLSASLPFYVALGAPALGQLIQRAVSREREFLADADAALLTRYPEGLARALSKMGATRGLQLRAGGATAHLYAVDPLRWNAPWWDRILSSHPPIQERIELLTQMGGGIAPSVLQAAAEAGADFARAHAGTIVPAPLQSEAPPPSMEEAARSAEAGLSGVAFRLMGPGANLYERPNMASKHLRHLPSGSMISVLERYGDFLRVITPQDEFGYVIKSASMTPVETPVRRPRSAG